MNGVQNGSLSLENISIIVVHAWGNNSYNETTLLDEWGNLYDLIQEASLGKYTYEG